MALKIKVPIDLKGKLVKAKRIDVTTRGLLIYNYKILQDYICCRPKVQLPIDLQINLKLLHSMYVQYTLSDSFEAPETHSCKLQMTTQ